MNESQKKRSFATNNQVVEVEGQDDTGKHLVVENVEMFSLDSSARNAVR